MEIIKYDTRYNDEVVDLYITVFSQAPWNETFDRNKVVNMVNNHAANNYFNAYLGIENGAVVAVSLGFMKPWYDGFEYYIEEFFVAPNSQHSGRGTALMAAIRQDLLQQDIHAIILMTRRDSPAAKFYTKDGFNAEPDLLVLDSYFK
ncbi:GNAT family N-acetyltransferase [Periweissella cryptocerci]|uniref:GNAT family N-acetyltransferase n=1 Tax=Periweissella cryptocerci TaxID=2506420 RepID=A0A4P6YR21_9LACO|nr:GNAT family N-acetyltransferase [Periweissella cryptocerci]QBO35042.1 GNAT family N-acetyltransferase [Periweissella cryptocerci]